MSEASPSKLESNWETGSCRYEVESLCDTLSAF
jgi:hypothetical protein